MPPASGGRGRRASKRRTEAPGQTVAQWARQQSESAWKRITLRQGEKGRLRAEYLHTRVWVWDGKEEQARCWRLLVRRECGAKSPSHYVLSNADEIDVSRVWRACRAAGSSSNTPFVKPRVTWPWRTIKCAAGMPGIGTW
ncbi:hypothetical protein, partial [Thiolapillus sp.]|uniref:hypothetical protein n=1 Tax=Thiolapillus sp. TaxID=2017437 RepID=UPI003AF512DA